jgi:hypothetical protein
MQAPIKPPIKIDLKTRTEISLSEENMSANNETQQALRHIGSQFEEDPTLTFVGNRFEAEVTVMFVGSQFEGELSLMRDFNPEGMFIDLGQ